MSQIEVIDQILRAKIVAIVRKESASVALSTAEAVINGGLSVLEISLNTPNAVDVIAELAGSKNLCVGAGTVMSEHQVDGVVAAGATFMVSPNTNERVIKYARSAGLVVGPGVFTASDCANALENGADFLKLFPAQLLGTAGLSALADPFPQVRWLPTGGIGLSNAHDWLVAGASALGVGGQLSSGAPQEIEAKARQFVTLIDQFSEGKTKRRNASDHDN
jgi:2-dehydro-3-deoxyphosphogluconate aldolase / (4S)-4-hydroxy-2-oxoglutarate aldolase